MIQNIFNLLDMNKHMVHLFHSRCVLTSGKDPVESSGSGLVGFVLQLFTLLFHSQGVLHQTPINK